MTPTAKFRWLDLSFSTTGYKDHPSAINFHGYRVLQQWWEGTPLFLDGHKIHQSQGEWRDIPIEREA